MRLPCLYRAERKGRGRDSLPSSPPRGPSCLSAPGSSPRASPPPPNSASLAAASQLELEAISPNHVGHFLRNRFPFNLFSRGSKKYERRAGKLPSLAEPALWRGRPYRTSAFGASATALCTAALPCSFPKQSDHLGQRHRSRRKRLTISPGKSSH